MTVPSAPKQVSRLAIALVAAAIAALLAMSFLALAHPAFLARPAFAADAGADAALAADANQGDAFAAASMPSDRESSDSDDEGATDAVVRSEEESTIAGNGAPQTQASRSMRQSSHSRTQAKRTGLPRSAHRAP